MKTGLFFLSLICCGALFSCKSKAPEHVKQSQMKYFIGEKGMCSLTIISPTHAVTASHCLPFMATPWGPERVPGVELYLEDGRVLEIEDVDFRLDRALLKGDFKDAQTIPVDAVQGRLFDVDEAYVCGYPGDSRILRCLRVKRVRNEGFQACYQATIIPGQSGGGVFSLNGTLIGIVQRVTDDGLSCFNTTTGMFKVEAQK